jgi:hypothetical protein
MDHTLSTAKLVHSIGCLSIANSLSIGFLLCQAQILKECIAVRLASQELFKTVHLFPTAALCENSLSVSPSSRSIHWRFLERGVEHVSAKYLGPEIAVISCYTLDSAFTERLQPTYQRHNHPSGVRKWPLRDQSRLPFPPASRAG